MVRAIRGYQRWLSPLLGPRCRFYPSCSHYAVDAITVHGPFVGVFLGSWRLLRCHPWNPGGIDAVPPRGGVRAYLAATDHTETDHTETVHPEPLARDDARLPSVPPAA